MHNTTTNATTAEVPAAQLKEQGFTPGAPARLPGSVIALDAHCYSRCPACGKRGRDFVPWQRGREYRALAVCRSGCGLADEV
jgi:hypothetical protein